MKNSLGKPEKWHSDAKRIEAVTTYLVLGKANLVGAAIGVPEGTIRQWKTQRWKELELQIQTESDQELDYKLSKRIEKALDLVNDRLENGDFQYDPKTGQFVRRPIAAKDGWKIANEMIDGGRTSHELVSAVLGEPRAGYDTVRDYWKGRLRTSDFDAIWRKALHDGVFADSALPAKRPALQGTIPAPPVARPGWEIIFRPDPAVWDGRFANNAWLQELPKPLTKLTWDNAALIGPADAEKLGVKNEDVVAYCKTLGDTGCGYYPNSSFEHLDVRDPGAGHVSWIDASGPGETKGLEGKT